MKRKHIYLILCFLWMSIIFWFSAQVADNSQGMSNRIIEFIDQLFHVNIVENGGWLFDVTSFVVRKGAHMSEYAILAILYALYLNAIDVKHVILIALCGVFLYASTDEFHQLFVEGRSGQLQDVLIDTIGGLIGLVGLQGYYFILSKIRSKSV